MPLEYGLCSFFLPCVHIPGLAIHVIPVKKIPVKILTGIDKQNSLYILDDGIPFIMSISFLTEGQLHSSPDTHDTDLFLQKTGKIENTLKIRHVRMLEHPACYRIRCHS